MKQLILVSLIILLCSEALFAPSRVEIVMPYTAPFNIYDALMSAVISVESQGDIYALNVKEQAEGSFQITPIMIEDYNQRTGSHYLPGDFFDYELSRKVFLYYTRGDDYETVAKRWNGSGEMTIEYWNKVKLLL